MGLLIVVLLLRLLRLEMRRLNAVRCARREPTVLLLHLHRREDARLALHRRGSSEHAG